MSQAIEQNPFANQTDEVLRTDQRENRIVGAIAYLAAGGLALIIPGELAAGEVATATLTGVGSLVFAGIGRYLRHEAGLMGQELTRRQAT